MQPLIAEILNHPTDLLALVDPDDLSLIVCNRNLEAYLNVNTEKFKGKSLYALIGKKVPREKINALTKRLNETHFHIDKETDPDNHVFFNVVNCGGSRCCVARFSSQRLNQSLLQFRQLFEKNLAGVYQSDIHGELLSCNQAFAQILGYNSPEELIGKNTSTLYKDPALRERYIEQLQMKPILMNFELEVVRKDGTVACCLENSYLDKSNSGVSLISGTLIDITEKREMEQALQESEQRFKSISSVSTEGVVFFSHDVIQDCNDQFARILGYATGVEVMGRELIEFIHPSDLQRIKTSVNISSANKTEIRIQNKAGKTIFLEVTGSHLMYQGKNSMAMVVVDITTRKKVEQALQQSVVGFRRLLENSPNGVIILTDERIRYLNFAACELLGVDDEDELYDKSFLTFFDKETKQTLKEDLTEIRNGQEIEYREVSLRNKRDEMVDVGIKSILTVYENKPSIQVTLNNVSTRNQLVQEQMRIRLIEEINTALKAEISGHKLTQEKLEKERRNATEQKAKLESIFNSTENLMMWTLDTDYHITVMNRNFASWMNDQFDVKVNVGDNILKVLEPHLDEDLYQGQLRAFENGFKGRPQQFEFALKNLRNETTWLQAFLNPVYMDDKQEELSCLLYDNTERKEFDRRIRDSLKEKEVLLQEVHHRVKNNLQVISSILNLQSSYVKDEKTLEVLRESQQRIKSMSFLHETIYRTADFSKLEFTNYLRSIASNLIQSYRTSETQIIFEDNMETVFLNLDQSIPCGLIVNELVSNALKYAFKGRKKGRLKISLNETDNIVNLMISDDGVGLPKEFNYDKTDSLGIQLVYALIEQLDAKMEVTNKKGASFSISFMKK
ncbi:MAG: PAS domain S-box protein [Flavobacteriales bacterium]|nr:PAS domain S-box protein [Flavobacteriales bacterium]